MVTKNSFKPTSRTNRVAQEIKPTSKPNRSNVVDEIKSKFALLKAAVEDNRHSDILLAITKIEAQINQL